MEKETVRAGVNSVEVKHRPGEIALSAVGWVELLISLVALLAGVEIVAISFALGSILFGMLAGQVSQGRYRRYDDDEVAISLRRTDRRAGRPSQPGPAYYPLMALATGLAVGCIVLVLMQQYSGGLTFALWAISVSLLATRMRQG